MYGDFEIMKEKNIMFVQIKAIRKGTKPPIWRRAYVPVGVTFAQMAYILEMLLELPVAEEYEFEFFQEKDRLVEGVSAEQIKTDYQFRYRDAVKAALKDWAQSKTWFTFRLNTDGEDLPQYRVEFEKLATDIKVGDEKKPLEQPLILKEVSVTEDHYWTSPQDLNKKLYDVCFLVEGKAKYPAFDLVLEQIQQGKGIAVSQNIKSRDNLIRNSGLDMLQEMADNIQKIAAETGGTQKNVADERGGIQKKTTAGPDPYGYNMGPKKTRSVEEVLKGYSKEDLRDVAEDYGYRLKVSSKNGMAHELARYILQPNVMRERLLEIDESSLDLFEAAIKKGRYLPGDYEVELLSELIMLEYIAEFSNGMIEVPEDVAAVYEIICRNGYREFHKKARWLMDCLFAFSLLYVVAEVDLLYKLYCQTNRFKADRAEFEDILTRIPDWLNECRRIGSRIVAEQAMQNDIYLELEKRQRQVPYYIPSESEILDYAINGYPASDPVYCRLYSFFEKDMGLGMPDCRDYCVKAYYVFSMGGMLSDYMEFLNERELVFRSDKQARKFAGLVMELNNNTRMFEMRGHTPIEMRAYAPLVTPGERMKVVPMSSDAARLLEEGRQQIQAMGFDVDTEESGTEIPMMGFKNGVSGEMKTGSRKIYPNDPCPCGSGKKFKKCCGRNK